MTDFVMPKNKRGKSPITAPEPECPVPVEEEPQADAPVPVETTSPEPSSEQPTTPIDHFAEWLKTPAGQDASDPRFLPEQAVRRQRELERRLKLAWDGATS
jgi:type IV secretory pathway VirB10-like protein